MELTTNAIDHFRFISAYLTKEEVIEQIDAHIEIEGNFKNHRTELIYRNKLINLVYGAEANAVHLKAIKN